MPSVYHEKHHWEWYSIEWNSLLRHYLPCNTYVRKSEISHIFEDEISLICKIPLALLAAGICTCLPHMQRSQDNFEGYPGFFACEYSGSNFVQHREVNEQIAALT